MSFLFTTVDKTELLFEIYKNSYETEIYQDAYLISKDGKRIRANKNVLAIASEFLEHLLFDFQSTVLIPEIYLPDVEGTILEKVVQFLYSGIIGIDPVQMSEFVSICNLLQIKGSIDCMGSFNGIKVTGQYIEEIPSTSTIQVVTSTPISKIQMKSKKTCLDSLVADLVTAEDDDIIEHEQSIDETVDEDKDIEMEGEIEGEKDEKHEEVVFYEIQDVTEENPTESEFLVDIEQSEEMDKDVKIYELQSSSDTIDDQLVLQAMKEIFSKRLSFHQAAEKYNISKTLLWRRAKKLGYEKGERPKSLNRMSAIEEIKKGESLLNVSKKYKIPIATLHRDKQALFNQGDLPDNVNFKMRKRGGDFDDRLRKTICEILNGKSQNEAAKNHKIPKATIWRIMKKIDVPNLERSAQVEPYSDEMDRLMESYTGYAKRKLKRELDDPEQEIYLVASDGTITAKNTSTTSQNSSLEMDNSAEISEPAPKRKRKKVVKKKEVATD